MRENEESEGENDGMRNFLRLKKEVIQEALSGAGRVDN